MPLPRLTGAQVRQLRERAGLARADLAPLMGIAVGTLENIEWGTGALSPYVQQILLVALHPMGRALITQAEKEVALFLSENQNRG